MFQFFVLLFFLTFHAATVVTVYVYMCECMRFCTSIAACIVVYIVSYFCVVLCRHFTTSSLRLLATLTHPNWRFTLARLQFYYCEHLVNLLQPFILLFVRFIFILCLHIFMSTAACNHACNRLLRTLLCYVIHCKRYMQASHYCLHGLPAALTNSHTSLYKKS